MRRVGWCTFSLLVVLCAALPATAQAITNPTLSEARELHGKGEIAAAIAKYQQVAKESKIESEVRHARFAVAACLFSIRDYNAAVAAFMQFAKEFPEDAQAPLALVHAGNCFYEQGRIDEAEPYYVRALGLQQPAENRRVWIGWANLGMGKVLHHRGQCEAALGYLEQAITLAPETLVSNEARGLLVECLDALRESGKDGTAAEWIGRSYFAVAKLHQDERGYQQAVELLQRTLATTTDGNLRADSYVREAECLFNLGRTQEALTATRAVELIQDTDQAFLEKRADWIVRATCWGVRAILRDDRPLETVEASDAVLSRYRGTDQGPVRELKLLKANALVNGGRVEQAIDLARDMRAENISDEWNIITEQMPGGYYMQVSRYPEAIQTFLGIINRNCGLAEYEAGARYQLAFCYWRTGSGQQAQDRLREITEQYSATSWNDAAEKALRSWFEPSATDSRGGESR